MHFFCHLLQIKNSQSQPAKAWWQCRRSDSPINLTPLLYVQTTHLCIKHRKTLRKQTHEKGKKIDSALLGTWRFLFSCGIFNLEVNDLNLYERRGLFPPLQVPLLCPDATFFKMTAIYIQHLKLIIVAKTKLKKAYIKKAWAMPPFAEINSDFFRAFHLFESNKCPFN